MPWLRAAASRVLADPRWLRRTAWASAFALGLLVVSGGAVRLSGSGLGCPTWPHCSGASVIAGGGLHHAIELGNRILTVVVFFGVAGAAALAFATRRRDLRRLAAGTVAGYLGQAVLGGITVLTRLDPLAVAAHFLLSMVLLWVAIVLYRRSGEQPGPAQPVVGPELRWLARGLTALAGAVLVVGTLVTGTGPHAGARVDNRLPFALRDITQLHSDLVLLLVGASAVTVLALRVAGAPAGLRRQSGVVLGLLAAQAVVGYTQYFLGLPAGLVEVHIAGATLVWTAVLWLMLSTWHRPALAGLDARPRADADREPATAAR